MSCDPDNSTVALSEPYIHIVQIFAAPPEALFDAWLQPQILHRWMSFNGTGEIQEVVAQHRVGGLFWIRERDGIGMSDRYGEYRAIDRPGRLVFTLNVPEHFPGTSCVTVSIAPSTNGSVMSFIQTGVRKDSLEATWRKMFDSLATVLR
jgi:uncharacterized protein YndB with AHSA1/START domain